MSRTDDPYAAPSTVQSRPAKTVPSEQPEGLNTIARETFLAWEKLRLLYVGVLAIASIVTGLARSQGSLATVEFWITVVVCAVPANLCYFAGPALEAYVRWLGFPTTALRWLLFTGGTLFAAMLAAVILNGSLLFTPD